MPDDAANDVVELRTALAAAEARIAQLEQIIHDLRRARFGQSIERVDPDQLALTLGATPPPPPASGADVPAPERKPASERRRNRGALPAHLERIETVIDVTDRACPCCRREMHRVGEDRAERLDVVPAQLRVRVTVRPRYACRRCEEGGVHQAPAPARIVVGGLPTEALLAHVLVSKYGDGLPLYRQRQILARGGIQLDRATLADWVRQACWWLRPLHELVLAHVVGHARVFADDTPLPTLAPGRGRTRDGRIWAYSADDRASGGTGPPAVAYVYAQDRKGIRPARHLAAFRGTLQVDGYGGFRALAERRNDGAIALAFCWAHLRRRFHKVHAHTASPIAAEALLRIGALYAIEREIRGRPAKERQAVRQERSAPLVHDLRLWLDAQLGRVSQGSALAAAIRYGLRHWDGLCRFLGDGSLELDTNSVEREIRPIVITRKAALFAGSEGGGESWAIATTLIRTAIFNGVNPQAWLTDVLERMVCGEVRSTELATLLPWVWRRASTAAAA
ncbi:MAG TPA: IS66 family transposase [Falsiroseomonas sp.]|nr:IS66 family transposase [Falsiroseomonas sp.]